MWPRPGRPPDRIFAPPSSISACPPLAAVERAQALRAHVRRAPPPPDAAPREHRPPAAPRAPRRQRRTGRAGTPRPTRSSTICYWLGTRQHSSWALRTSDGLIIIDTNFAWATEPEIINGLTTLGLNPRDIKYVIISHAHGDHDQGAAELQKRYGAKVVMGAADWDATLKRPADRCGRRADTRYLGRAGGHQSDPG